MQCENLTFLCTLSGLMNILTTQFFPFTEDECITFSRNIEMRCKAIADMPFNSSVVKKDTTSGIFEYPNSRYLNVFQ